MITCDLKSRTRDNKFVTIARISSQGVFIRRSNANTIHSSAVCFGYDSLSPQNIPREQHARAQHNELMISCETSQHPMSFYAHVVVHFVDVVSLKTIDENIQENCFHLV